MTVASDFSRGATVQAENLHSELTGLCFREAFDFQKEGRRNELWWVDVIFLERERHYICPATRG
jgi:hypothetical protein